MKKILFFIMAVVMTSLSPNLIFSQTAPNLNTAARFVLFTGNGEFTSTSPTSIVIGNVGNEVGVASAFPPGFLSGTKHFNDATATQAGTDIAAAYADLAGRTCGTPHTVGFGGGEILAPGVYCSGAASTLSGNITLDAAGNPAAVFIIKIDGAFSSVAGAQVILVNQASSCNVFWQVNGAVVLNNTVLKGSMLVNGSVNLNGGIVDGRILVTTGALIFDSVIVSICDNTLLPLQLVSFEVTKTAGDNVQVSWITTSEVDVSHYEVEASVDGASFRSIGAVASKENSFPTRYSLVDKQAKTGVWFYRLKMIDKDGAYTYSAVKSIKFSDSRFGLVNIFPNPASNIITMTVNAENTGNFAVTISNVQGQTILQKIRMIDKGISNITEDIHSLAKGTYILSIKNINTGEKTRQNFQKL